MTPAVALILAICCGPGLNNCGCDRKQEAPPLWTNDAGTMHLTGTSFTVEYDSVHDCYSVRKADVQIGTRDFLEDAETYALEVAGKMQQIGQTP